jgi:hypothetical protein
VDYDRYIRPGDVNTPKDTEFLYITDQDKNTALAPFAFGIWGQSPRWFSYTTAGDGRKGPPVALAGVHGRRVDRSQVSVSASTTSTLERHRSSSRRTKNKQSSKDRPGEQQAADVDFV